VRKYADLYLDYLCVNTAGLLTQVFVLTPLEFLRHLSLPNWLILASLVVFLSWLFWGMMNAEVGKRLKYKG
jgi:hypothetical protein